MKALGAATGLTAVKKRKRSSNRHYRWIRTLHVYSSMLMLLIMLFFTVTGLTLNHRQRLPDPPPAEFSELELPDRFKNPSAWSTSPMQEADKVRRWLSNEHKLRGTQVEYDWWPDEQLLVIDVKRPGGYTLVEVFPEEGVVMLERQSYGVIAVLNDLHMGRYGGPLWRAFIDLSAILMLVFTLTGLWLIFPMKKIRQRSFQLSVVGGVIMMAAYALILM